MFTISCQIMNGSINILQYVVCINNEPLINGLVYKCCCWFSIDHIGSEHVTCCTYMCFFI